MKINYGLGSWFVLSVAAALGATFLILSFKLPGGVTGPAYYPRLLIGLLFVLISLALISSIKRQEFCKSITIPDLPLLMFFATAQIGYLVMFKYLGYYPSTILFGLSVFVVLQRHKPLKQNLIHSVLLTAGFCLFVEVIFVKVFGVRL